MRRDISGTTVNMLQVRHRDQAGPEVHAKLSTHQCMVLNERRILSFKPLSDPSPPPNFLKPVDAVQSAYSDPVTWQVRLIWQQSDGDNRQHLPLPIRLRRGSGFCSDTKNCNSYSLLRCVTVDGTHHKGDGHRRTNIEFHKRCSISENQVGSNGIYRSLTTISTNLQLASYKTWRPGRRKRPFNSFTLSQENEINEKKQP